MRDLIAPRRARRAAAASRPSATTGRTGARPTVSVTKTAKGDAEEAPGTVRSRAKNRSEQAAVAKGAELARARAKASKSRRSDPSR